MTTPGEKPQVFFWQNMPAAMQTGALEHFAAHWGSPVTGVWCADISPFRRQLGWATTEHPHLRDVFLPARDWVAPVERIVAANPDAIHVLSGIGAYPPVTHAARRLARLPAPQIGLIVESPVLITWRKWPRILKAHFHYRRHLRRIKAVLAMGQHGIDFYRRLGFGDGQLFPYMYQARGGSAAPVASRAGPVRMAYVGQLHRRKGADVLLAALGGLRDLPWTLAVFGDGPERSRLERQARAAGISARVRFAGVIALAEVHACWQQHDLAIVPSRFDGWGAVVNEALQAGLPVIASDRTGASDLIRASGAGAVFATGDSAGLARLLAARIADPQQLAEEGHRARLFAPNLTQEVVGAYLREVIDHAFLAIGDKPSPRWLNWAPDRA